MEDALITILKNVAKDDELRIDLCKRIQDDIPSACFGVNCNDCPFNSSDNLRQLTDK